MGFQPTVADEIWSRFPEYRALSVSVLGFSAFAAADVAPAAVSAPASPAWMEAHVEAWRQAFRAFGANPKKTSCSVEALWKRLQKNGELPAIDPVVDLYNALSIRFGAPFGGEDMAKYVGAPRLCVATGAEAFDTTKDGVAIVEHPEVGEVIWQDENGVTCRRWNWRQCKRTALAQESRDLWFVIDRLGPMPVEALQRAGEELVKGLRGLCPGVEAEMSLLEP